MSYEETLLGTGGTLLRNRDFSGSEPIMLIHADNLCFADFQSFINFHNNRPKNTIITMMTFTTNTPYTCGIVVLDKYGVIQSFYEKVKNPPGNIANGAVYIIEPQIFDFLSKLNKPYIDFSIDVLPFLLNKIYTYHNNNYHRDIGSLESYLSAQIECPVSLKEQNIDSDSWLKLCQKDRGILSDMMVSALAQALNAEIIQVIMGQIKSSKNVDLISKNILIHVKEFITDYSFFSNIYNDYLVYNKNCFFYLENTFSGFSSRELFEKYGLKSLALCSSAMQ
jgi:dTDP-glucose pyrophosphorylase